MYPLILIGIFATILGMGNATIASIDPEAVDTIGQITPVLMVLVLASFLVLLSPLIVTMVAGDFALGAVTAIVSARAMKTGAGALRSGGAAARGLVTGLLASSHQQAQAFQPARATTQDKQLGAWSQIPRRT
ncbi:hypothetical protein F1642_14665 [Paracoccus sp. NBH48]|nr:hypothetical protein [Paracoccus sp. NBH48]